MEEIEDKVYENKICSLCSKCNECNHDKFTEEKFYNGITNRRCRDYEYKNKE